MFSVYFLCAVCFRAGQVARSFARNLRVSGNDIMALAMATAAPLDLSPAAPSERVSMPRSIQDFDQRAVFETFFGFSLASHYGRLSLPLDDSGKTCGIRGSVERWTQKKKGLNEHYLAAKAEICSLLAKMGLFATCARKLFVFEWN